MRGTRRTLALALVWAAAASPGGAVAQTATRPESDGGPAWFAPPSGRGPRRIEAPRAALAPADPVRAKPQEIERVSPLLATLSSLAIPGMGQLLLGQKRWTAYAGLELVGWVVHLNHLREGRRARATYRDLAWAAARGMPNPREEAEWAYYEALGSWERSGAYDLDDTRGGLQPETDEDTFNGAIWALASDLYLPPDQSPDPGAYQKAVDYYERRAVGPAFLWDWTGREDSQVLYRDLIHESDEALRTASMVLGGVIANHLFSTADAFVSSRLRGEAPVRATVGWRPSPGGGGLEWRVEVRR